MPKGDRTGPLGLGSGTGRGRGFCAGYDMQGSINPENVQNNFSGGGLGRWLGNGLKQCWSGFGRGLGFHGRRWSRDYTNPRSNSFSNNPDVEKRWVEENIKRLDMELEALKNFASDLAKEKSAQSNKEVNS